MELATWARGLTRGEMYAVSDHMMRSLLGLGAAPTSAPTASPTGSHTGAGAGEGEGDDTLVNIGGPTAAPTTSNGGGGNGGGGNGGGGNGGGKSSRNASWWAQRPPNRKYPWHNFSDFMPAIRNVTAPQHEVGPWESWQMYFPPNVTNGTHLSNATNATLIPRNSSWWNENNRTFPSFNGSNASTHAGKGYGGPCRAWFGFRCTEEGGCGV